VSPWLGIKQILNSDFTPGQGHSKEFKPHSQFLTATAGHFAT